MGEKHYAEHRFLKLHYAYGEEVYVKASAITEIHNHIINVLGCPTYLNVRETPEQILDMLLACVIEPE